MLPSVRSKTAQKRPEMSCPPQLLSRYQLEMSQKPRKHSPTLIWSAAHSIDPKWLLFSPNILLLLVLMFPAPHSPSFKDIPSLAQYMLSMA